MILNFAKFIYSLHIAFASTIINIQVTSIYYMRYRKFYLYKFNLCLLFFVLVFSACLNKDQYADSKAKKQLHFIDSILAIGKDDSAVNILLKTRSQISSSDPAISVFYVMEANLNFMQPEKMDLFADSALAFFDSDSKIKKYPNEYFNALLAKGDACLKTAKYVSALNYYYKARTLSATQKCDDGTLDGKMGIIYYGQQNFKMAARYWGESYNRLEQCHDGIPAEKMFNIEQGALNNTGFSYERASILDSADYFYQLDLQLINRADSNNVISKRNILPARAVLYDNLGGLNLKWGRLTAAETYLNKSIAIPLPDINGLKIPPLLKLAELYLTVGDNKKAITVFLKSRALLDRFGQDNRGSEIKWYKLFAEYLFKINQPAKAYLNQDRYIKLRDSVDNTSAEFYRLDVERELSGISQQQQLIELEQKDKIRWLYLVGISITVFLFVVIIFLINRNLKRAQKNNKAATQHNRQLQIALDELELLNKNYIRIMRVMAHDLRNPLSGITGLSAVLLEEDSLSDENKHMVRLIEATSLHTIEMINELLKSGLADESEQMVKQDVDLRSLLYDSVELLQFRANEKHQQLLFEGDDKPIIARVNHEKIWRVFNNLIVNAIKFSHENGVIRTGIRIKNNRIIIYVADNGIGIPYKDKDTIFDMFTPAKKTGTNGEEPFGLGLSISKRIIEMHKGKIWFENNPEGGVIFFIELPD